MAYRRRTRSIRRRRAPYGRRRTYRRRRRYSTRRARRGASRRRGMVAIPRSIPKLMRPEFKFVAWSQLWDGIDGTAFASTFTDLAKLILHQNSFHGYVGTRYHALRLDLRYTIMPQWFPYNQSVTQLPYINGANQCGLYFMLVSIDTLGNFYPSTALNILGNLYDLPQDAEGDPRVWFRNVHGPQTLKIRVIKRWIWKMPQNATMVAEGDAVTYTLRPIAQSFIIKKRIKINKTVIIEPGTGGNPNPTRNGLFLISRVLNYAVDHEQGTAYFPGKIQLNAKLTFTDP